MANMDKWTGSNPWLGLASYTEGTPLYGRDKESVILTDIIKDNMTTIVFGKSGVGKSSLIGAGISPALREELYIPIKIRLVHNSEVSYMEQIENAVREQVVCSDLLPSSINDLGLWDFFHRHSFSTSEGEECIPVIILDQFEEIYTLTDDAHKAGIHDFFKELSPLLNDIKPDHVYEVEKQHKTIQTPASSANSSKLVIKRSGTSAFRYNEAINFRFVFCLREDKLYLLERNTANIPALKANRFNLQALTTDSAYHVVVCPRPGLFTENEATDIIDKLADMGDEGVRTVDPAILSLFLYKYYEKRGAANADNIFADYYKEATRSIDTKAIAYLEDHLLTLGGYRNQVPLDDALSSGVTQKELESLFSRVILRTEKRKGVDYIEFSHDRLCAEAKKNREERNMRKQARKVRRRMLLSIIVFTISGGILAYVLLLLGQLQSAEEQNEIISKQKREIAVQSDSLRKSLQLQEAQNVTITIQKGEIAEQRDELQAKNKTLTAQQQEIERKNAELQSKNKELTAQLATIKKQQLEIQELRSEYAGGLHEKLPYPNLISESSFTISGNINTDDIAYLKHGFETGKLKHIDLTNANFVTDGTSNEFAAMIWRKATSLETVKLPKSLKKIGDGAFSQCPNLTSVTIHNGVTYIGGYAFAGCNKLFNITLPESIEFIEEAAFQGCSSLQSIKIPHKVTKIGAMAFRDCYNLSSVIIPKGIVTIPIYAFNNCKSLSHLTIPNGVTSIGASAFYGCSGLMSITIPNGVTSIGESAFRGCSGLKSITIPNSVTSIGLFALSGCNNLTLINSRIKNINALFHDETLFDHCPSNCTWYVPAGTAKDYKAQSWWKPTWDIKEGEAPIK